MPVPKILAAVVVIATMLIFLAAVQRRERSGASESADHYHTGGSSRLGWRGGFPHAPGTGGRSLPRRRRRLPPKPFLDANEW